MQRETLDQISTDFAQQNIAKLAGEPPISKEDLVYMTFEDRLAFQRYMNKHKEQYDCDGVLLVPFREKHQIQTKKLKRRIHKQTDFVKEEHQSRREADISEKAMNREVPKELLNCYLVIEVLGKTPISQIFRYLPNEYFLHFNKLSKRIRRTMDLYTIVDNIFRGMYTSPADFQNDMVMMIHQFKQYYIHYPLIMGEILEFQELFWKVYKEELPKYLHAVIEHVKTKRQAGRYGMVRKPSLKKYNKQERLKLQTLIKNQRPQTIKKIFEYLKTTEFREEIVREAKVELALLPFKHLRAIQALCEGNEDYLIDQAAEKYYNTQEINEALKANNFMPDDIYEESEES